MEVKSNSTSSTTTNTTSNNYKYGYKILFPNGNFFAFCSRKTFNKYVKNSKKFKIIDSITVQFIDFPQIDKNPNNFIYTHDPNGNNYCNSCSLKEKANIFDDINDEYFNVELSKISVISKEFLKWIPDTKSFNQKLFVLLCQDCRKIFESCFYEHRKNLLQQFNLTNMIFKEKNIEQIVPAKVIVEHFIQNKKINELIEDFIKVYNENLNPCKLLESPFKQKIIKI